MQEKMQGMEFAKKTVLQVKVTFFHAVNVSNLKIYMYVQIFAIIS